MEKIYKAYQRKVNNEVLYFVKEYYSFPDLSDSAVILENYGMHANFFKACKIAQIRDKQVIRSLHQQFEPEKHEGKIVSIETENAGNSFLNNTRRAFFKLKLASIF